MPEPRVLTDDVGSLKARVRQLEKGYDTLRTALHRAEARAEKAEQAARRMARLLAEVLDCGVSARSRDYDEVQLDHQLRREITAALREDG